MRNLNFIVKILENVLKEWGNDKIRFGLSKCDSTMKHRLEDKEAKGTDPR